jgi:two-component system, NtrC family, sensor kinase
VIQQEKMAAFGLLAAGIAHEVGNPLAALSALVQILERRGPDPYTAEKLDLAARQLHRIERTIRELVDFSRPASTVVAQVRIAEVVDEALGIAKYYQRTKQRSITTSVPADLPAVPCVRDYLTQVVLNLVLNAIDATDDQGRIYVKARAEEGWLILSVDDDGRGVSVADRCRLFQPFFTTKSHGTGLGLFVSRQILEDFAGTLSFRSEPGEGSIFVVRLPLARGASTGSATAMPDPSGAVSTEPDSRLDVSRPEPAGGRNVAALAAPARVGDTLS